MKSLTYVEMDVDYCANTYGEDPCTATTDADVAVATALDPTLTSDVTSVGGFVFREQILAAAFSAVDGNRIRITFKPPASGNTTLSNVYVGHSGVSFPNFDGFQRRVTFNTGHSNTTLTGGGASVVSDDIDFKFDHTRALVVSMDITGTSNVRGIVAAGSNFNHCSKAGDSANVGSTTVTGYTSNANSIYAIDKFYP